MSLSQKSSLLISVFICPLIIYLLFSVGLKGIANLKYYQVNTIYRAAVSADSSFTKQQYINAIELIEDAIKLDGMNPDYSFLYGKMIQMGVKKELINPDKLLQAKEHYYKSAKLRPLWPESWVALLRLNHYLYGFNEETQFFMSKSIKSGPYTDVVNVSVSQVLMLNSEKLTSNQRETLYKQFYAASKRNKVIEQVLSFAEQTDKLNIYCPYVKFNSKFEGFRANHLYYQYCIQS